jgi:dolichyl-diphosphooligosaccharide--protein glycosyltransferase
MPPKPKTLSKSPVPISDPTQHLAVDDAPLANSSLQSAGAAPSGVSATKEGGRKLAYPLPRHISPTTINNTQSLLRFVILGLISAAAIGSRLFAVIRFESVIHELCVAKPSLLLWEDRRYGCNG